MTDELSARGELLWVTVEMTVNGTPLMYSMSVTSLQWEYPEYKLAVVDRLKRKLLDEATRGMEPKVTVSKYMPPMGTIPDGIVEGSDVTVTSP